jgi:hypothetical protein
MNLLNEEQIRALADMVLEQYGPGLSEDELTEYTLELLEDVSGFEGAPERLVRKVTNDVRRYYHGECTEKQELRNREYRYSRV